jgi:serine/threonine protein kinase
MNKETIIDKYELIEKIGEGAFGVVFKAKNLLFNKIIALKIIKGASEEQLNSFLREIRKMDKLTPHHPNVMRIISADIKENALLIEMEYFEGKTLLRLLQENKVLDEEIIIEYLKQILDALSFIHSKRLVHRDIKPDNILLNKDYSFVKVSDFGISKDLDYSSSDTIQGAFSYMSPEQLTDPSKVDHRSDFYSLAVVIYQLKTGEIPFSGTITNIIDGKRFKSIPKTNSFLDPIIQKASKKNPIERYSNADEFKFDLVNAYEKSRKKSNSTYLWIYVILVLSCFLFYIFKDDFLSLEVKTNKKEEIKIDKPTINTINLIDQTWMAENLKVKEFKNGSPIKETLSKVEWDFACRNQIPAYCHLYNDPSNDEKYGLLYNWYAAKDSICPDGFKIPTKSDFDKLISNYDFPKLNSQFNIVFPGYKGDENNFHEFNNGLFLWSKDEKYKGCVYTLKVFKSDNKGAIKLGEQKPSDGYSIRGIKIND